MLLAAVVLLLSGCTDKKIYGDNGDSNQIVGEKTVSFSISSDGAVSGGEAAATVSINDNPGFLTMALKIEFDPQVMQLTKIENGTDFADYNFVPAKELKNGCWVSWFTAGLQNLPKNCELMTLYFHVSDTAEPGKYLISISPADDGSIVDGNKNPMVVTGGKSVIIVK